MSNRNVHNEYMQPDVDDHPRTGIFAGLGSFFTDHKTELKGKLVALKGDVVVKRAEIKSIMETTKKVRSLLSSYKKTPAVLTPTEKRKKQELKEQRKMMKGDGVSFATFREKKEKRVKAVKKELTADEKKAAAKEKKDALEKKIASFTPAELLAYQKKIKTTKDNAKKTANERKEKKNLKIKNDNILTQMGF